MARVGFLTASGVDLDIAVYDDEDDIFDYGGLGKVHYLRFKIGGAYRYIGLVKDTDTGSHPMYDDGSPCFNDAAGQCWRMLKRSSFVEKKMEFTSVGTSIEDIFPSRVKLGTTLAVLVASGSTPSSGGGAGGTGMGASFEAGGGGGAGGHGGHGAFGGIARTDPYLTIIEDNPDAITAEVTVGPAIAGTPGLGGSPGVWGSYYPTGGSAPTSLSGESVSSIRLSSFTAYVAEFHPGSPGYWYGEGGEAGRGGENVSPTGAYGGLNGYSFMIKSVVYIEGELFVDFERHPNTTSLNTRGASASGGSYGAGGVYADPGHTGAYTKTLTVTGVTGSFSLSFSPAAGGAGGNGGRGAANIFDTPASGQAGHNGNPGVSGYAGIVISYWW